jgi:hypothetical protein
MRECEHNDAGYTIVCLHACMLTCEHNDASYTLARLRAYTLDMRKCEQSDAGYTIVCLHACMLTCEHNDAGYTLARLRASTLVMLACEHNDESCTLARCARSPMSAMAERAACKGVEWRLCSHAGAFEPIACAKCPKPHTADSPQATWGKELRTYIHTFGWWNVYTDTMPYRHTGSDGYMYQEIITPYHTHMQAWIG